MLEWLVQQLGEHSLGVAGALVFGVLLLCGFGLPIPEDIILVTGGVLAWLASESAPADLHSTLHATEFWAMVSVGMAGILAGDSVIFWAGRLYGAKLAEHPLLRRVVTAEKLAKVHELMRRRGNLVVVVARYLPGLRAPTYFTAGHAKLPYWEFLLFDGLAALVSAPAWVFLGYYFGSDIELAARKAAQFGHYILAAVLVVVIPMAIRWWLRGRQQAAVVPPKVAPPPPASVDEH
jgi:membrane protein DedA with SNARE-associated domain